MRAAWRYVPELAECVDQLHERRVQRAARVATASASGFVGGSGTWRNMRDRKDHPPDRHAQKGEPRRDAAVGEAEPVRLQDPQQVDEQQDAAAEVSQRVARSRHAIHLVIGRDVRQQRIVEDEAARDPDVGDDEEPLGKPPVAGSDEHHGRRRQDADGHADRRASASSPREIGVGAENRARRSAMKISARVVAVAKRAVASGARQAGAATAL